MNPSAGGQLELLGRSEPEAEVRANARLLGLLLSQREWLHFLGSEWLAPKESGRLLLGVGCLVGEDPRGGEPNVGVWFDLDQLPAIKVRAFANGKWELSELRALGGGHCAVAWQGPLPLFAVRTFSVASDAERRHILALAQGFRDVEPPTQPVEVQGAHALVPVEPDEHPALTGAMYPPANWNALRGAASMAAWSVPTIDPWLDLLCESLQDSAPNQSAEQLRAEWWRTALWTCHSNAVSDDPLWTAILSELGTVGSPKALRPNESLENICVRAKTLGAAPSRIDRLRESTQGLLDDRTTIQKGGVIDDVLALALQLLLLRPNPDRYAAWREDWFAVPPGAWWTGATLCGFLTGFRGLPKEYRGSPEARRLLALRTWKLGCGGDTGLWDEVTREKLDWVADGERIYLRSNEHRWADLRLSRRGRWYHMDFSNEAARKVAEEFIREAQPEMLTSHLVLREGRFAILGNGTVRVEQKTRALVVKDKIELELGVDAFVEKRFSKNRFKDWVATASIDAALPRTVFEAPRLTELKAQEPPARELPGIGATLPPATKKVKSSARASKKASHANAEPPPGLSIRNDFISEDEERSLMATIDGHVWDTNMLRRVQHYGWKYDYKKRKVDQASFLGPLPEWLMTLAMRLVEAGILQEMPDQVIVNNYDEDQGISAHVDCVPCFRGPIVMVSLNESWEMLFARKGARSGSPKYAQVLPRRSATVLEGEARLNWMHEIPQRKSEPDFVRARRVSITFRKVAV